MNRDLTIQESVLDRFFDTEDGTTTGLYLENYGVVLITQKSSMYADQIHIRVVKSDSTRQGNTEVHTSKMPEEKTHIYQTQITEFLGTYGDAIGQLKNNDKITLLLLPAKYNFTPPTAIRIAAPQIDYRVVDIDSLHADSIHVEKRVYRTPGRRHQIDIDRVVNTRDHVYQTAHGHDSTLHTEHNNTPFEATVIKRDIDAFSQGKIDLQTFQNRIAFYTHKSNSDRDKKIDIMADILSSALKQDTELHIFNHTKSTGLYHQNIGALFLLSHTFERIWMDEKSQKNPLESFKTTILETLADYGATLRDLSPDEFILVHANLNGSHTRHIVSIYDKNKKNPPSAQNQPERLLFRVSKRNVDAYANGKINLETFRTRVEIVEM